MIMAKRLVVSMLSWYLLLLLPLHLQDYLQKSCCYVVRYFEFEI